MFYIWLHITVPMLGWHSSSASSLLSY